MHNFRLIKMERYNHSMKFLNFYMYCLLPLCTLYTVISFTWRQTVPGTGFYSSADFVMSFLTMILAIFAVMTIWDVDLFAYITNTLFVVDLTVFKILGIFSPAFSELSEATENVSPAMGNMDPSIMNGAMGSSAYGALDMTQQHVGLLTKIIQKFAGSVVDVTQFEKALKLEIILLIGLALILFFIKHAKFFLTPVEKFKQVYGFEDGGDDFSL